MVSEEKLVRILKKTLEKVESLEEEIVELRRKNKELQTNHKEALLHAMSPKEREALEEEEILSSDLMQKCVDLVIADGKRRRRL